jgi:hypothetical protein
LRKNQDRGHLRRQPPIRVGEPASDVAALHQAVDIALSLTKLYLATSSVTSSGNLSRFARISLTTICLVLAAIPEVAEVVLAAGGPCVRRHLAPEGEHS